MASNAVMKSNAAGAEKVAEPPEVALRDLPASAVPDWIAVLVSSLAARDNLR
jgi:hypothetical protein